MNMRVAKPRIQQAITSNPKLIIIIFILLLLGFAFFVTQSSFSSSVSVKSQNYSSSRNKIPLSLSESIIHYATTKITPQQTPKEIAITDRVLRRKSPCNFLVFGLGHDSLMWASLNHGGRTVFLEEDKDWIRKIADKFPSLNYHHVVYDTKLNQSQELLTVARKDKRCYQTEVDPRKSECVLAHKKLPKEIFEVEWDLIMVDAPRGYDDGTPGRMSVIYTVGLMARNRMEGDTDVFLHDVNRDVEDKFSKEFLCEGYMAEQQGKLRHFIIPSHRTSHGIASGRPFCPSV